MGFIRKYAVLCMVGGVLMAALIGISGCAIQLPEKNTLSTHEMQDDSPEGEDGGALYRGEDPTTAIEDSDEGIAPEF